MATMSASKTTHLREALRAGKIDAFLFDLDGTLYSSTAGLEDQIRPGMRRRVSELLGKDEDEARELMVRYRSEYGHGVLGLQVEHGIDPERFLADVFDRLDRSVIEPYPGLPKILAAAAERVELFLITNSNRSHAEAVLSLLGVRSHFARVFAIEDAGYRLRPRPDGYQVFLKATGYQPSAVAAFDDSYLNLEVANQMGMYTVLVSNGLAPYPDFWEMHRRERHGAPPWVDDSAPGICVFLEQALDLT
jgi:putative hydrolase of the HAD superfamily